MYKKSIFIVVFLFFVLLIGSYGSIVSKAQTQSKYTVKINKTVGLNSNEGVVIVNNDFDYRIKVLDEYFVRNKSPLAGYGKYFFKACEKYGAPEDCTLLPAIGYIETRLCTLALSDKQKNCWGWGGAGENRVIFPDYETAIDEITKKLMTIPFYGTKFFNDPVYGQFYYCGKHCDKYGTYVQQAREDINKLAEEMGYPKLF